MAALVLYPLLHSRLSTRPYKLSQQAAVEEAPRWRKRWEERKWRSSTVSVLAPLPTCCLPACSSGLPCTQTLQLHSTDMVGVKLGSYQSSIQAFRCQLNML